MQIAHLLGGKIMENPAQGCLGNLNYPAFLFNGHGGTGDEVGASVTCLALHISLALQNVKSAFDGCGIFFQKG